MTPDWDGAALSLSDKDTLAWEKARQAIEANRCGDLIVHVVDEHGEPLVGVPVHYQQRRHAFRFGVQYPYSAQVYDLLQAAGVNAATLWLGWKYVQPEQGLFNLKYLDRVWNPATLHERSLRLTAHALNWFKPAWNVLPQYLHDTPKAQLPHLVYEHVQTLARHWLGFMDTFELVNEPFWADARAIPLELEDMVRICHATALAVRDVIPQARLEVNFAEVSRTPSYQVHPNDLIEALDKANVPYDSIGLQAFENAYSITAPPTFYRPKTFTGILQTLRQYARLGKPLHISALAAPSAPPRIKPPTAFKPPYGEWNEATQARYLDAAYTLFFAQPEVTEITWWCPVDGRLSFIASGGLLREDLSPKPSYDALKHWISRHTSEGLVRSMEQGKAFVHGYAGDYDLTVGVGAMGRRLTYSIEERMIQDHTVVLSYNP